METKEETANESRIEREGRTLAQRRPAFGKRNIGEDADGRIQELTLRIQQSPNLTVLIAESDDLEREPERRLRKKNFEN